MSTLDPNNYNDPIATSAWARRYHDLSLIRADIAEMTPVPDEPVTPEE